MDIIRCAPYTATSAGCLTRLTVLLSASLGDFAENETRCGLPMGGLRRLLDALSCSLPEIPPHGDEMFAQAFPGGFNVRDEANALTAYAFRNGMLEGLHAGKSSRLTSDPKLSRITDAEMKELMIDASEKIASLLELRDSEPEKYKLFVKFYGLMYCSKWNR